MSDYEQKVAAFQKYGMDAIEKLFQEYSELCLSLPPEKEIAQAIVALTRLRPEVPDSVESAYSIMEKYFAELIVTGQIKIREYGLSALGQEEYNNLLNPPVPSTEPTDVYRQVVELYKTNVNEFNRLRSVDPDFRTRSDEANQLGILR